MSLSCQIKILLLNLISASGLHLKILTSNMTIFLDSAGWLLFIEYVFNDPIR